MKLCQLELGPKRAIEWILEDFEIFIPQKVFDDGRANLLDTDDETRIIFFQRVQNQVYYEDITACEELMRDYVHRLPPPDRTHIDEGERIATALALRLSYECRQYVVLVTDDFKAIEPLRRILEEHQIGLIKNSFDLLLFLAGRYRDVLVPEEVEIALRQLTHLLRDNTPTAPKHQKPDEVLESSRTFLTAITDSSTKERLLDCINRQGENK
ncbi:MAG: hypothetical protein D6732_14420 [Methanobacteriota archaeon]|nr:MAG: hypothetical protein D6732_14420 [Euryarchaeota archaeon]